MVTMPNVTVPRQIKTIRHHFKNQKYSFAIILLLKEHVLVTQITTLLL